MERETGLEPATTCLEGLMNFFPLLRFNSQSKPEADASPGRRSSHFYLIIGWGLHVFQVGVGTSGQFLNSRS